MLRLATGEREVILMHCLEDSLCVRPPSITELSYNLAMIEGHPVWSGRARHSYGHLPFTDIEEGTYQIEQLQITNPEVIRTEFDVKGFCVSCHELVLTSQRTLSMLLQAAGEGCSSLHTVPIEGRDIRDDQIANEQDLQQVLIDMVPTPGMGNVEGGRPIRALLTEFLRGFSLRTLIFLMDMVLPQLDAYHSRRHYSTSSRG